MKNYKGIFSNPVNPISALQTFFGSAKYLKEEKEFFYPDPNDPDDSRISWTNNKITSVDRKTESYEIEYEEDIDWEIDESVPGRPTLIPVKSEWRKKTIYFKDRLGEFLSEIVEDSKELIETHISLSANKTANKSNISFWLDNLKKILSVTNSKPQFSKYPVCSVYVLSLIKFITKKFYTILSQRHKNISNIPSTPVHGNRSLAVKFYSEILRVEDEDANLLFDDMSTASANIRFIAGGNIDSLTEINFLWPKEAVYYLLNRIRFFNRPTFAIGKLVSSPKVKFKGDSITASTFSKGHKVFITKTTPLKITIDNLFDRYSSYE